MNRNNNINLKINDILKNQKLNREQNCFFKNAALIQNISLDNSIQIAFNWLFITKQFLYTTIRGLSPFVDNIFKNKSSHNENLLKVLQTSFYVISDDLSSVHPIFKKVAPKGIYGIHYKWWEDTILNKITPLSLFQPTLQDEVNNLITKMYEISTSPFGTPVQLRVVEAIALDISLAFQSIFSKVKYRQEYVFNSEDDKLWITSHIEAEVLHNKQVCDTETGIACIVVNHEDEIQLLTLVTEYAKSWAEALDAFAKYITY